MIKKQWKTQRNVASNSVESLCNIFVWNSIYCVRHVAVHERCQQKRRSREMQTTHNVVRVNAECSFELFDLSHRINTYHIFGFELFPVWCLMNFDFDAQCTIAHTARRFNVFIGDKNWPKNTIANCRYIVWMPFHRTKWSMVINLSYRANDHQRTIILNHT